jgi:hypothetical protein
MGDDAMFFNTTGSFNTAIGDDALDNNVDGNSNVAIGDEAGTAVVHASHVIAIGADMSGADVSNTTWIGNVYGTTTQSATTLPVIVSNTGQLGTAASSARFKKDIKPMDQSSETVLRLKPVTFHYKADSTATAQFGLIAEEVEKVNPDLVVKDKEGKVFTVRYDAVNAMLLNEFLKEHSKVENLKASIAQQREEMKTVLAQLREQEAKIQKVSAEVELRKPAPRTVLNDQ